MPSNLPSAPCLDARLPETHLALETVMMDKYDYASAAGDFHTAAELDPHNA